MKTTLVQNGRHPGEVLLRPRITEKATFIAEFGAYVFDVATGANKREIAEAVRAVYSVSPAHVRVLAVAEKKKMVRGRPGRRPGGKKAYVFLTKGEKIESL